MGNIIATAKANGIDIKGPENVNDVEKVIQALEIKPSEGLQAIWKNAKEGFIDRCWACEIAKPCTIKTFKKGESCDGFAGFSKINGLKAYYVMCLWAGTDSRTPMFEMMEGDEKGKIICFPYSDTAMYHTGKTVDDLLKLIEEMKWDDADDAMQFITDKIMPASTRDNSPKENESDDE